MGLNRTVLGSSRETIDLPVPRLRVVGRDMCCPGATPSVRSSFVYSIISLGPRDSIMGQLANLLKYEFIRNCPSGWSCRGEVPLLTWPFTGVVAPAIA